MTIEKYTNRFVTLRNSDLLVVYTRVNGQHALFDDRDAKIITTLILDHQKKSPLKDKLTIMLHSQGGDIVHAIKIATILQSMYPKCIETVVFNISKSSMALSALIGQTCFMHPDAALSDFSINENETLSAKDSRSINLEIFRVLSAGVLKVEEDATVTKVLVELLFSTKPHGTDISYAEIRALIPNAIKPVGEIGKEHFHLSSIHKMLLDQFDEKSGLYKVIGFNGEYTSV